MRVRLENKWEEIRSSYYFVPGLMAIGALLLSLVMVYIDRNYPLDWNERWRMIWSGGPQGARELLSTMAGSMITVAGVTFSITIVALSLASQQFGPRLLRSFMRDTGNQVVLGTFTSTYIYCLLVLRVIREGGEGEFSFTPFVPNLSITVAILLGVFSLGVLIYFFHHVASTIQAPVMISEVAEDLFETIERLYPVEIGKTKAHLPGYRPEDDVPKNFEEECLRIPIPVSGYLQAIDTGSLMYMAQEYDLVLRLMVRPGHFATEGGVLIKAWPFERLKQPLVQALQDTFLIGRHRTSSQDVEYAIDQLVEVAVRSLSAAINDPFTAMNCIDWLGAGLSRLAQKNFPSPYRYDDAGKLRVIVDRPFTFEGIIEDAFNQVRQHAAKNAAVTIRLLGVIKAVSEHTQNEVYRQALRRQAVMIERASDIMLPEKEDRDDVDERFLEAVHSDAEDNPDLLPRA